MLPNKQIAVVAILMMCFSGVRGQAIVDGLGLPEDFPEIIITRTDEATPGVFIGTVTQGPSTYNVVLDGLGYPLFYSKTEELSNHVQPNGLIAIGDRGIKGFRFQDETFAQVDSFTLQGQEYELDSHDLKLLPNGHCLLMAKEFRHIDMSQIIPDGQPDAIVTGNVIQELNANKEVVFEWHTFDHMSIADSFWGITKKNIDYAHINSIALDPLDNTIIASFRQTMDIVKISRSTGEIVWRLGGRANDFTFIGEHEENAPLYFVGQHSAIRLTNGNLLLFDNGRNGRGDATPSDRIYSRAVEYYLDEVNMTATLVWEYRHTSDISAKSKGDVKRFDNGNTFIEWGGAKRDTGFICTEVSPSGEIVHEIAFLEPGPSASMTKQVWNSRDLVTSKTYANIEVGQTYESSSTGVSVTVNGLTGSATNNGLVVKKHHVATRFPRFSGQSPQLLVPRVTLAGYGMTAVHQDVTFSTQDLDSADPSQLTVYHRPNVGQGEFTALATTFDDINKTLVVTDTLPGEFVFGYPDVPEIANVPRLRGPEDMGTANEAQPVALKWGPNGFFRSYALQIATDAAFSKLVVDQAGLKMSGYVLASVDPGTTYYWRVNTTNDGGTSEWATRSFTTVAPMVQVTAPNGNERWQRGLEYFVRWEDNLAEDVVIELCKGDAFVKTIATIPSLGAYQWEVDLAVEPGDDYWLKIKSATDETIWGQSNAIFSIE